MPEKIIIHQVKQGKIILLNKDACLQTNKFNNTNNTLELKVITWIGTLHTPSKRYPRNRRVL